MKTEKPKKPRSTAQRAHSRRAAFKHGRYARSISKTEKATAALAKLSRQLPAVTRAVASAMSGDPTEWQSLTAQGMAALQLNFQEAQQEIARAGLVVEESVIAGDRVVGTKKKLNDAFVAVDKLADRLGLRADSQLLTPLARGQGIKDRLEAMKAQHEIKIMDSRRKHEGVAIEAAFTEARKQLPPKGGTSLKDAMTTLEIPPPFPDEPEPDDSMTRSGYPKTREARDRARLSYGAFPNPMGVTEEWIAQHKAARQVVIDRIARYEREREKGIDEK